MRASDIFFSISIRSAKVLVNSLSEEFDLVAIAVSCQTSEELLISHFILNANLYRLNCLLNEDRIYLAFNGVRENLFSQDSIQKESLEKRI